MGHAVPPRFAAVACLAMLTLAGCGRRGPLELPPGVPPVPQAAAAVTPQIPDQPGLIQSPDQVFETPAAAKLNAEASHPPPPINAPPAPRHSGFVLDSLL